MFLGKKTGKLGTTSDFMQQISRSDQKSQQAVLRIIQGKESYCSSIHQQSAAIRSSPSSVSFSSLCGSLNTCELHSLLLKHRITRSLPKIFLVHRNRSTSTLFWDHWQAIYSQSCTPSPRQRKARTPSSSELVSQEGLYLLMIVLSVSPSRPQPDRPAPVWSRTWSDRGRFLSPAKRPGLRAPCASRSRTHPPKAAKSSFPAH